LNFRQVLLQLIDLLLKVLHLLIFSAARSVKPRVQLHQAFSLNLKALLLVLESELLFER